MSLEVYAAYLLACIVIIIVPGPTVTLIIANSLKHGTARWPPQRGRNPGRPRDHGRGRRHRPQLASSRRSVTGSSGCGWRALPT